MFCGWAGNRRLGIALVCGASDYTDLGSGTPVEHGTFKVYRTEKGSPCSITERSVPELIPVLCSQHAGDVSHKPGGRLPLLSAWPTVTPATLKTAATNFAAW